MGTLALLTVPFVFTQDDLLTTGQFIDAANKQGNRLSVQDLCEFHKRGLLAPLYRIDDHPTMELRLASPQLASWNTNQIETSRAAAEGRLRDPAKEGYSDDFPFDVSDGLTPRKWWNGYLYSSWQLLGLHHVVNHRDVVVAANSQWELSTSWVPRFRERVRALIALAPRFMPGVVGQLSVPPGAGEEDYWTFRRDSDPMALLEMASFDPTNLRSEAENLLLTAHRRDPLADWLPLMRHSSHAGWFKLKGEALACIWIRIAAELLLRAHEEIAASNLLEPLPSLAGTNYWSPLHDRLGLHANQADSLERALGSFNLSPHPRVLLLVEGETELNHVPALLAEVGLERPEQVRVQLCKGSNVNVQLITRYGIAPRLGRKIGDVQLVDRTPTALLIAMDPENLWETQAKRDAQKHKLQEAIREEVVLQGGDIGQEDLDFLVNVRVWGEDKYELANFSDDELVVALTQLAQAQSNPRVTTPTWDADLRAELHAARLQHSDIKVPSGRMRISEDKTALAALLWPTLLAKCKAELASGAAVTPVLQLVLDAERLVGQLSATGYALRKADV